MRARRRLSLSRYKTQGKSQLGARLRLNIVKKRRRRKDEDFLVQKSLALWPPKFTVRSERNVFPSFFFLFPFFFVARLPVGENTSLCLAGATPVPHKERRASVVLICLHCSKEGTVYPRKTMRQLRKVCHAEGVLCLSSWQQS